MNKYIMEFILCILRYSVNVLLLVFIIVFTIICLIVMVLILRRVLCNKSWCGIKTDVSVSIDGGTNYIRNFHHVSYGQTVYLKYEISARASGFLSNFSIYKIPFRIKAPHKMNISVYEYSGICNPKLKEGFEMTEPTTFYITAMGRKTEAVKIILKCERIPKTNTIAVFRLAFLNRGLRRYSKTLALEF